MRSIGRLVMSWRTRHFFQSACLGEGLNRFNELYYVAASPRVDMFLLVSMATRSGNTTKEKPSEELMMLLISTDELMFRSVGVGIEIGLGMPEIP
jgi:hypothetical protein